MNDFFFQVILDAPFHPNRHRLLRRENAIPDEIEHALIGRRQTNDDYLYHANL